MSYFILKSSEVVSFWGRSSPTLGPLEAQLQNPLLKFLDLSLLLIQCKVQIYLYPKIVGDYRAPVNFLI